MGLRKGTSLTGTWLRMFTRSRWPAAAVGSRCVSGDTYRGEAPLLCGRVWGFAVSGAVDHSHITSSGVGATLIIFELLLHVDRCGDRLGCLFGVLQGTDRWQSATLFDPTDAGAGGFYSLSACLLVALDCMRCSDLSTCTPNWDYA